MNRMAYRPDPPPPGRRPIVEPEIIPPDRGSRRRDGDEPPPVWVGRHRIVLAPPGPFAMLAGLLGLAAVAVMGTLLFLGLFLFFVPILGAVVVGAILAALLRGPRRF